jgi:hypothetical protein
MPHPTMRPRLPRSKRGWRRGEARVESDGDVVIYRGVSDIMAALNYFRNKAAQLPAPQTRNRSSVAVFSRE